MENLEALDKRGEKQAQKGREALSKVKTMTWFNKTTSMIDKTMALFDKTKPMNTLFRNWGRFSNLRLECGVAIAIR